MQIWVPISQRFSDIGVSIRSSHDQENMPDCYNCDKEGDLKRCAGCQHAYYCSKACQKRHWRKHKPNCIPPQSSLHELFRACILDVFPSPSTAQEYGFDNMKLYHGDLLSPFEEFPEATAGHILLGLYQIITKDIANDELPCGMVPVHNSIGASKKMMLEAFERNALDEFLYRYISSVIARYGDQLPRGNYCLEWIQNKLVIGPTRLSLGDSVQVTQEQVMQMRNDIYRRYYGTST